MKRKSEYKYLLLTRCIFVLETYFWIPLTFPVLSELWLDGSTQFFWLKILSKLTVSSWLLSGSHWISQVGLKLTWACSFLFSGFNCLCYVNYMNSRTKSTHCTQRSDSQVTQLHWTDFVSLLVLLVCQLFFLCVLVSVGHILCLTQFIKAFSDSSLWLSLIRHSFQSWLLPFPKKLYHDSLGLGQSVFL